MKSFKDIIKVTANNKFNFASVMFAIVVLFIVTAYENSFYYTILGYLTVIFGNFIEKENLAMLFDFVFIMTCYFLFQTIVMTALYLYHKKYEKNA